MNILKKKLEQRDKHELIAIIQPMLRQKPDLRWLLATRMHADRERVAATYRKRA
jgi:hypothetical protein